MENIQSDFRIKKGQELSRAYKIDNQAQCVIELGKNI